MEHNAVKSPLHYTEGRKYEPKDVIRDWGLNFNLGSALKYIARAGRKGNTVEDLEKAREYLAFEIIHAFLYESGLDVNSLSGGAWAKNEEMVDWMAIQMPKIYQAYQEAEALEEV